MVGISSLKVTGTGIGPTGTDLMREALEILGFCPRHHMRELIKDPSMNVSGDRLWKWLRQTGIFCWGGYASCRLAFSVLLTATGWGLPEGTGHSDMASSRKLVGKFHITPPVWIEKPGSDLAISYNKAIHRMNRWIVFQINPAWIQKEDNHGFRKI